MTEEMLVSYFYDELTRDERASVDAALANDPALATRYAALSRELLAWRAPEPASVPVHIEAQWHDSIDRLANAASMPARPRAPYLRVFGWGSALAVALVAGIGIGLRLNQQTTSTAVTDAPLAGVENLRDAIVPASFTRGLQQHLQESQWQIDRLTGVADADRVSLTMQLIEQNRVFERAALQSNAANLARVLRAFEPILLQLANEDIAPQDMEALRAQLAFELNVMLTKLRQSPSDPAQPI
jgi:hypothetical protein